MFACCNCNLHVVTDDEDFAQVTELSFVFLSETPITSTYCFDVVINDDELVEHDEKFSVSISSSDPVNAVPISTKTITIINNDCNNYGSHN